MWASGSREPARGVGVCFACAVKSPPSTVLASQMAARCLWWRPCTPPDGQGVHCLVRFGGASSQARAWEWSGVFQGISSQATVVAPYRVVALVRRGRIDTSGHFFIVSNHKVFSRCCFSLDFGAFFGMSTKFFCEKCVHLKWSKSLELYV